MIPVPNRFTATPDPVAPGGDLKICFDNPNLAGDTIEVKLDNGQGLEDSIHITLDESGHGCVTWTVPATGWDLVKMNEPSSAENVVVVS